VGADAEVGAIRKLLKIQMNSNLQGINHFVVLMLENRSFDHLLGGLKSLDPRIAGLTGNESCPDPYGTGAPVKVGLATQFAMSFDPDHEFEDIQMQLYGIDPNAPDQANPRVDPAPMSGFPTSAYAAASAASVPDDRKRVMEYFAPGSLSVLMPLAQEFALFNFWYSSLPGPTWPNRFFVHAATSGGLTDSPDTGSIVAGFSFANKTIYDNLKAAGKDWRIYHDGLPQSIGITSLRQEYVDPATTHFREMKYFAEDVQNGALPEYTFIEPQYDTGGNYAGGNSMHPLNDVRLGEQLVKTVYETLRQSADYWLDTMLIITFDEHGGFFDHVPPPKAVPTGDDTKYQNQDHPFGFDLLGVRVPAIVISAYTAAGTVIGQDAADPAGIFDHTSILRTVELRFGLPPLTARDKSANTLDVAVNLNSPRSDAPITLADPMSDTLSPAPTVNPAATS
jgi:phospholipase C